MCRNDVFTLKRNARRARNNNNDNNKVARRERNFGAPINGAVSRVESMPPNKRLALCARKSRVNLSS